MIKPALSLIDAAIIAMTITVIAPDLWRLVGPEWFGQERIEGCDPTDRLHGFAFLRNDCAETRPMIKWTNERIAGAREEVRDLGIFALEYAKPTDTFGVTMVLALAEIGLRVVDPSPEDVERVAAVMFNWTRPIVTAQANSAFGSRTFVFPMAITGCAEPAPRSRQSQRRTIDDRAL